MLAAIVSAMSSQSPGVDLATVAPTWQPGSPVYVLATLKPLPDWHTYWTNPGDSGAAPRIEWKLPKGWTAQPILFSVPHRVGDEEMMSYGYEGDTDLVVKLVPPVRGGQAPVEIVGNVRWMACLAQCVAYETPVQLKLQYGTPSSRDEGVAKRIQVVLKDQGDLDSSIRVTRSAMGYRISGTGLDVPIDFFSSDSDTTRHNQSPVISKSASGWNLDVPISEYLSRPPRRLRGLLLFSANGTRRTIRIDHPIADAALGGNK